ncbi:MAG: menaquinone biosynthesis protein [Chitinophagaceae bacterium]
MKKTKIAAVDYLNTKPLLYGIKKSAVAMKITLLEAYPSEVAQLLIDGKVDVGLVPVAVIPQLKESHIISDYCIASDGPVASVCIFSDVPMEQVERIYLDYQSRTSVMLARILLRDYWQCNVPLLPTKEDGYRKAIEGTTAGLVIGDRALEQRLHSRYVYDLGEAWKAHTGLPFVFAAWVSNNVLSPEFLTAFNAANGLGFEELPQVIKENPYKLFSLHDYYTKYISYRLDEEKRRGLQLFLEKLSTL